MQKVDKDGKLLVRRLEYLLEKNTSLKEGRKKQQNKGKQLRYCIYLYML